MGYVNNKYTWSVVMDYLVEKEFPFSCQPVDSDTYGESDIANQLVFALLECMGDGITLTRAQDFASDIERLEYKLNLVIFMLNNLVQPAQPRPASQLLRMGADSIAWQSDTMVKPGQTMIITLYLSPMIPIPLQCCTHVREQNAQWCTAGLVGLPEEAMSAWSRWVFRQHRHTIAQSREHGPLQTR